MNFPPLNEAGLKESVGQLASSDPLLAGVQARFGDPPLWQRVQGFPTLVHIILEQQVSLASAQAAFDRLHHRLGGITPEDFLTLDDGELKEIGFSRQKTSYCRGLAEAVLDNTLELESLADMPDRQVHDALVRIRGIGTWTATIYLLMALGRPDLWPRGDIALAESYRQLAGKTQRPGSDEMEKIARRWAPYRSVAARLLWHNYLSLRNGSSAGF